MKKHREKGDGSAECMSITSATETESERKVVAGFSNFYLLTALLLIKEVNSYASQHLTHRLNIIICIHSVTGDCISTCVAVSCGIEYLFCWFLCSFSVFPFFTLFFASLFNFVMGRMTVVIVLHVLKKYLENYFHLFFIWKTNLLKLQDSSNCAVYFHFVARSWIKKATVPSRQRSWRGSSFTTLRTITSSTWRKFLTATVASKAQVSLVPLESGTTNCDGSVERMRGDFSIPNHFWHCLIHWLSKCILSVCINIIFLYKYYSDCWYSTEPQGI